MHKRFMVVLAVSIAALALGGCSEPITGAYEATIVLENGQSRLAGIAIFKEDQLIADGQTARVHHWTEEGGVLTAIGSEGEQLFQIERIGEGEYAQKIPGGQIVFRKYDLPAFPTW
jgi:hypothetical protein